MRDVNEKPFFLGTTDILFATDKDKDFAEPICSKGGDCSLLRFDDEDFDHDVLARWLGKCRTPTIRFPRLFSPKRCATKIMGNVSPNL